MRKILLCFILILTVSCSSKEAVYAPIVQIMPEVEPHMNTAGYWISQAMYPDHLIMTAEEIQRFNAAITNSSYLPDIAEFPHEVKGSSIKLADTFWQNVNKAEYYNLNGELHKAEELERIRQNIKVEHVAPEQIYPVKKGVIVEYSHQRVIPSEDMFLRKNDAGYFDRIQMSSLDIGTPVIILHESLDKKWLFVRSKLTVGWIKTENVALASQEEILFWEKNSDFAVFTDYKTSIYCDNIRKKYCGFVPMGVRLPIYRDNMSLNSTALNVGLKDIISIVLPKRNDDGFLYEEVAFVEKRHVNIGYLPYTSRNMLVLSFKMLNAPYGWGGMYAEQDCSGFLIRLFNTVGIVLPRNSAEQGKTGTPISEIAETKRALVDFGIPGAAVIQFPGHIMLYVGEKNNEPYVIHAIWSYEALNNSGDRVLKLPSRVILSTLNLSAHTEKGAYDKRAVNVRNLIY